MKRWHWLNTWVGAVVGALPPLVGWTAATGGSMSVAALTLAGVLYAWQIPHFLSLSWTIRREYERGGYEMLARRLAHKVAPATLLWALYCLPLGACCAAANLTTPLFALTSLAPGVPLVLAARAFARHRSEQASRRVFRATLAWLPIFLVLMMAHKREWLGVRLTNGADDDRAPTSVQ
jgi:protoheme IX farnesyltransferase